MTALWRRQHAGSIDRLPAASVAGELIKLVPVAILFATDGGFIVIAAMWRRRLMPSCRVGMTISMLLNNPEAARSLNAGIEIVTLLPW